MTAPAGPAHVVLSDFTAATFHGHADTRSPATAAAGDALEAFAPYPAPPGTVPCACSCPDPDACSCGDGRPRYAPMPEWNEAHPDSPSGRTLRRLAADRAAGVLPGAEPGQGVAVLPYLTDYELGAWTQALLAEHHRRQSRFADYRAGARAAGGML